MLPTLFLSFFLCSQANASWGTNPTHPWVQSCWVGECRVCPLQLPSLGTTQLPAKPGRHVPRVPPPAPWGSGAPGWLEKALLMRALKIEWDWDLNGTLWETWKHFLIPINESRCINDDCIAS